MSDPKSVPIPKQFYSSETQQPFKNCLMCNQSLDQLQYVVEKAIKNYPTLGTTEIIFEYAMCLSCAAKMHMELSEESRGRIEAYMAAHLKNKTKPLETRDTNASLSKCMVRETDLSQSSEYSIYALCNGGEMVVNELPCIEWGGTR